MLGLSLADVQEAPEQRELAQDRRGRAHHCLLCDDTCFPCAAAKAVSVAARHLSRCGADAVSERVWAGLNGPGGAARFRSLSCSAGGAAAATDIAAASFVSDDATTVGSVGGVATGMAAVGV